MNSKIDLNDKIVLVTGANQGIGFELCRQLAKYGCTVVLTSRNIEEGMKARKILSQENLDVQYHQQALYSSTYMMETY